MLIDSYEIRSVKNLLALMNLLDKLQAFCW